MRFYSMSWQDLMKLPIRAFWMISGQIPRLRSEESLEQIELHLLANQGISGEMIAGYRQALSERVGCTAVFREVEAPDTHAKGIAELMRLGI